MEKVSLGFTSNNTRGIVLELWLTSSRSSHREINIMRSLTYKQRLFVEFYLGESSKEPVDAAHRAGYCRPEAMAPRVVKNPRVQAAIRAEAESAAMTSSEVLARVAEVASTDLLDFMHVSEAGIAQVDLRQTRRRGMGHLIKRLRVNRNGTQEIELEPRLPALLKLGEHYKLWKVEAEPQVTLVDIAKNLRDQYAQMEREGRLDEQCQVPWKSNEVFP